MDLPSLLPLEFKSLASVLNDQELYEMLLSSRESFVRFFSYAADDETWSLHHLEFYRLALGWFTNRYLQNQLGDAQAKVIVRVLQEHYSFLSLILPRPIQVKFAESSIAVNPLIIGFKSPYFKNYLRKDSEGDSRKIIISEQDGEIISFALHYLETENAEELWRFEKTKIGDLLNISEKWGILSLSNECEAILKRYISYDTVESELKLSFKKRRSLLLERCIEVYNEKMKGVILSSSHFDILSLEFLDFSEDAFLAFHPLKTILTKLCFRNHLTMDENFIKVMKECPHFITLDLRMSLNESPFFNQLPLCIREVDLSECGWLGDKELRMITPFIPNIEALSLAQDTQLSYRGFSELKNLRNLKSLDLGRCYQLDIEALNLILQGAFALISLNVCGCRKLSDQAFYEIGRRSPSLLEIKISRTTLTDGALLDIAIHCPRLEYVEMNHCLNISEGGLSDFFRKAKALRRISLKDNRFDADFIDLLRKTFPTIAISESYESNDFDSQL